MKKQVVKEERICDVEGCEKWVCDSCLGCGVDHCYTHKKELGINYQYSIYYQGTGDGYYCHECDKRLQALGTDLLYSYYLIMKELIDEYKTFHENFEKREKELSLRIQILYDRRLKEMEKEK